MHHTDHSEFQVDNASILFLARMFPYHNNSFRFTMTMREEVCPETLQKAVDRIWKRFPSVIAGFQPGFFRFRQVPASMPPQVQPDPGLLATFRKEERSKCCFRVYYQGRDISLELFHALTDGSGTITTFTTLVAEYLSLRYGLVTPVSQLRLDVSEGPQPHELADSFLDNAGAKPRSLCNRYAYQIPRGPDADWQVRISPLTMDAKLLLNAAHKYEVTLNTLLTSILACSVMEYQKQRKTRLKPVRIMVPVDLRRQFGSRTLRNFTLYALPTLEAADHDRPLKEICGSIARQLEQQLSRESLAGMISYNVRTQNSPLFRCIPWAVKSAAMRLGYRFFGEVNSSLTLTNLGRVQLPEEFRAYVENFQANLTPRTGSPYACTVLTYGSNVTIKISKFCENTELEEIFFRNLKAVVAQ